MPTDEKHPRPRHRLWVSLKSFWEGVFGLTILISPFIILGLLVNLTTCEPRPPITAEDIWELLSAAEKRLIVDPTIHELCARHGIQNRTIQDKIGVFLWLHWFSNYDHADHIAAFAKSIGLPVETLASVVEEWLRDLTKTNRSGHESLNMIDDTLLQTSYYAPTPVGKIISNEVSPAAPLTGKRGATLR